MEGKVFVLAIIAIGCLTGIITSWINRNKGAGIDQKVFERLAKAFMEHKKESERRIQNLEAIIADDDINTSSNQIEEPKSTIEIEEKEDQKTRSDDGNLSNMLRE